MILEQELREPTSAEADVILRLIAADFPERKEIVGQLRRYRVRRIDNEGSLRLEPDRAAPPAGGNKRVPVEAEAQDTDGITVHFLLHLDNDGFATESEIHEDDGSPIIRMPRADELDVMASGSFAYKPKVDGV